MSLMGLLKRPKKRWGNIQFFHNQRGSVAFDCKRFTAAVDVPTKKQLLKLRDKFADADRHEHPRVMLKIGKTTVNPKDQYVKEIGREFSFKRVEPHLFFLNKVETTCGQTLFQFDGVLENHRTQVTITVTPNSDRGQLRHVLLRKFPRTLEDVVGKTDTQTFSANSSEVTNAKPEEMPTRTTSENGSTPVRIAILDECGGDQ